MVEEFVLLSSFVDSLLIPANSVLGNQKRRGALFGFIRPSENRVMGVKGQESQGQRESDLHTHRK